MWTLERTTIWLFSFARDVDRDLISFSSAQCQRWQTLRAFRCQAKRTTLIFLHLSNNIHIVMLSCSSPSPPFFFIYCKTAKFNLRNSLIFQKHAISFNLVLTHVTSSPLLHVGWDDETTMFDEKEEKIETFHTILTSWHPDSRSFHYRERHRLSS